MDTGKTVFVCITLIVYGALFAHFVIKVYNG